jgi:hypothetical protein
LIPTHTDIFESMRFTHHLPRKKIKTFVAALGCEDGNRKPLTPKLMIMANSWGASKAHFLSEHYESQCGEKPELFIMIVVLENQCTLGRKLLQQNDV